MRVACTEYLTLIHAGWQKSKEIDNKGEDPFQLNYFLLIGQLRAAVGRQLAILHNQYGLEIHEPLAQLMPGKSEDIEKRYQESKRDIKKSIDIANRSHPGRYEEA